LISTRASAIAKPGVLVGHERRCRNRPGESLGPDLIERRHVVDVRQVDVGLDDVAGAEAGAGERREELLADQIDRLELDAVALPQMAVGHLGLGRDAAQVARLMRRQKARHENQVAGLDHRHERRGRGDIEAIGKDRLDRRPVGRDRDHVGHHGGARDQHLRLQDRRVGSDIGAAGGAPRLVKKRDRAPVLKKLIAAHQPRHVGAAGAQDIGAPCQTDLACRSHAGAPERGRSVSPRSSGIRPATNTQCPARTPRASGMRAGPASLTERARVSVSAAMRLESACRMPPANVGEFARLRRLAATVGSDDPSTGAACKDNMGPDRVSISAAETGRRHGKP
jgi:hypothetical protein